MEERKVILTLHIGGNVYEDPCRIWIKEYRSIITTFLKNVKEVLDLGTNGMLNIRLVSEVIPQARITSVDNVHKNLDLAMKEYRDLISSRKLDLKLMSLERLEFKDESFDAVISFNTLHRSKDIFSLLREALRVTKRGGIIILCDWGPSASFLKCTKEPADKLAQIMSNTLVEIERMQSILGNELIKEAIMVITPVYVLVLRKGKE